MEWLVWFLVQMHALQAIDYIVLYMVILCFFFSMRKYRSSNHLLIGRISSATLNSPYYPGVWLSLINGYDGIFKTLNCSINCYILLHTLVNLTSPGRVCPPCQEFPSQKISPTPWVTLSQWWTFPGCLPLLRWKSAGPQHYQGPHLSPWVMLTSRAIRCVCVCMNICFHFFNIGLIFLVLLQ